MSQISIFFTESRPSYLGDTSQPGGSSQPGGTGYLPSSVQHPNDKYDFTITRSPGNSNALVVGRDRETSTEIRQHLTAPPGDTFGTIASTMKVRRPPPPQKPKCVKQKLPYCFINGHHSHIT